MFNRLNEIASLASKLSLDNLQSTEFKDEANLKLYNDALLDNQNLKNELLLQSNEIKLLKASIERLPELESALGM
jgi:hypothetical protein